MKKSEADIIRAALAWWHGRRPPSYTLGDHIGDPSASTSPMTTSESLSVVLSAAVANYERMRLKKEGKRAKSRRKV